MFVFGFDITNSLGKDTINIVFKTIFYNFVFANGLLIETV